MPHSSGEIVARPAASRSQDASSGLRRLDQRGDRSALLYVPASYSPERPAPLVVMLHGAGGTAEHSVNLLRCHADEYGFVLLAPTSEAATWDVIAGRRYGPDVKAIDDALSQVFRRYAIDPHRIAVAGFSDGASYALSLGLMNGELFRHVLAFSPGFMAPLDERGRPRVFISHGVWDAVLPIDPCSRRIARDLRSAGYDLEYAEFPDKHSVPPAMIERALARFLSG